MSTMDQVESVAGEELTALTPPADTEAILEAVK
jgi:hypothetical protein